MRRMYRLIGQGSGEQRWSSSRLRLRRLGRFGSWGALIRRSLVLNVVSTGRVPVYRSLLVIQYVGLLKDAHR